MTKVYRVWCEWDIGEHTKVFSTPEKAVEWARDRSSEILEPQGCGSFDELLSDGLIGIEEYDYD